MDLKNLETSEAWSEEDPYHPQPIVYSKIADSVISFLDSLTRDPRGAEAKRPRTVSMEDDGQGRSRGCWEQRQERGRGGFRGGRGDHSGWRPRGHGENRGRGGGGPRQY
jgi:hypothetical protein